MTSQQIAEFGWRVPDFPAGNTRGHAFMAQIEENLAAAQEGGFASAWIADHFVPWPRWEDVETDNMECWTTLTYFTARFQRLTWGSIVLCQSYRNPALLAKMVAQLCTLAPGRVVFGIGAGWKEDEYRAYGYEFPPIRTRIAQLAETVEIARRLWTTSGPVTFEGQHYAIRDAHLQPKPDPVPPIMIGGGGERLMLRLVAEQADWYNLPGGSMDIYKHKLDVLAQHCAAIGRDPASIRNTWACECVAVAPARDDAQRIAEASPFYDPHSAIAGTPDDVAAALGRWIEAGVSHFQLRFADFPRLDGVKLFAREVLPRFGRRR
jgi:alkanesulfonate monooxygenase SsuD/methylene tetrahydromethanopterin reductase-like flavin-dependent oxidoreductase (luciferase family)